MCVATRASLRGGPDNSLSGCCRHKKFLSCLPRPPFASCCFTTRIARYPGHPIKGKALLRAPAPILLAPHTVIPIRRIA